MPTGKGPDRHRTQKGIMKLAISHRGNKAREVSFIKVYSVKYLIIFSSNIDRFPWGPLDTNPNSFMLI